MGERLQVAQGRGRRPGTRPQDPRKRSRRRYRIQVRRRHRHQRGQGLRRAIDREGRRPDRSPPRANRKQRRLRGPLEREGREDEGLGRCRARLRNGRAGPGPRDRSHQGWAQGRHRRPGVSSRIARRRPAGEEPRRASRPGIPHARHQGQQAARQHRAFAQGRSRRGKHRKEEEDARGPRRGGRSSVEP